MSIPRYTSDPDHPGLTRGVDEQPVPQAEVYLVLSDEDLAKGYIRPFRRAYMHKDCGTVTSMGEKLAATYAADPGYYGATYCVQCQMHRPVAEFTWADDGQVVGS